jgi:hypothetical protein
MKTTGKITPEIQMKAETFVAHGYQKLLTFEVSGGGFEWFGRAPANQVLTAYGLMEFHDMSRVRDVDQNMIQRTANWLLSRQKSDGSWDPDKEYLHAESWSKIQGKSLLTTSYVTWALLESEIKDNRIDRGVNFIANGADKEDDPYILGLIANALFTKDKKHPKGIEVLNKLTTLAKTDGEQTYWPGLATVTYSTGKSADLETTAMIALAYLKSGRDTAVVQRILKYLVKNKDAYGNWHSTNATIFALKALLRSRLGSEFTKPVDVLVKIDGKQVGEVKINPAQSDLMHQIDLGKNFNPGKHKVEISLNGQGALTFQVSGRFYLPWKMMPPEEQSLLALDVDYDRTDLSVTEAITCKVTAKLNKGDVAKMVMLDIGIPPGFSVETDGLVKLMEQGVFQRFSQTPRQMMFYVDQLTKEKPLNFSFSMRARYPIRAKVPENQAYLYYNPEQKTVKKPLQMVVEGKKK